MLEIRNLSASRGKNKIFEHISFALIPCTTTAVIGKNGCGKSTLCECINRMLPYTGEILFSGRSIALMPPRERASYISFLPQLLPSPHITVQELIALGRSPYIDIGHRMTADDIKKCAESARCIGVENLLSKYVDELSGGERQKAYLAMTLAQDTSVMILDEPTTYMDIAFEHSFMNTLKSLRDEKKKTLLVIIHNINQAIRHADNIAVIDGGRLAFFGNVKSCIEQQIIESVFNVKRYVAQNGEIFYSA